MDVDADVGCEVFMRSKRIAASFAGAVMIVSLSACNGAEDSLEGLSGPEVMDRVQEDMGTVSSLNISGEVEVEDGARGLDLALDTDDNYEGTYSLDDVEADIRIVDGRLFVRGDERFWTDSGLAADAQMAMSFEDMWVALPGSPQPDSGLGGSCDLESFMVVLPGGPEPGATFAGMCDLESLLAEITEADWDSVSRGETTQIDGTPALELIAEDDQGTTRMWVSTGEDNHILKLMREGTEPDEFTLGDYNEPVDVSVPDEDEILDLAGAGNLLSRLSAESMGGSDDTNSDC